MRYSKIRGAFEKHFTPQQGGTSHAEKIKTLKNIERPIIADFKTNFTKEYFMGFQNENKLKVGASVKATINNKVVEAKVI